MAREFDHLAVGEEFYFQWHLTEKCNLRCRHCYHTSYKSTGELIPDQLFQIVDAMDLAAARWGRRATLSLTGGEPLLRRQDLLEVITYIEKKPHIYYFDLLTNGTLLDDALVARLADFNKLRRVQLSLEGPDAQSNDQVRGTGTFKRVIAAIKGLKAHGLAVSIMNTLHRGNFARVREMVTLAADLGVDCLSFERFIPEGQGREMETMALSRQELQETLQLITTLATNERRVRILTYRPLYALAGQDASLGAMCSIGINALTIMHDGTVYPCRRLPLPLGNILSDGLFKIWYDSEILWRIRDCRNLQGKCHDCELIVSCRGCRAAAYFASGNYLAEDPQCWK